MIDGAFSPVSAMHMLNNCLIVPLTSDVDDRYALKLQKDILIFVKTVGVKKVLIDMSVVRILDGLCFSILKDAAKMVSMLGARVVFVGFQAGVASALVDLDADIDDIVTVITMDEGFDLLKDELPDVLSDDGDIDENIDGFSPEDDDGLLEACDDFDC